jgi:hypothetical protein
VWPSAEVLRRAGATLAVVALASGLIDCGSSASKAGVASSHERTLRLFSYGDCCGGFQPVPFGKDPGAPFIAYLETNGLTDADGKKVGYYHAAWTLEPDRVAPRAQPGSLCAVYLNLRDGQIVAQGAASDQVPTTVPIIGGTGSYLGARGSITTVGVTRIGYWFVVHLR